MLAKINRIGGLGLVFSDFNWKPDVPAFRAVNLIYGWNGCGKTTLTRLFAELPHPSLDGLSFEVEDSDGAKFGEEDAFPSPIRVFNQDYIQKNVRIQESSANTISLLLGEASKELVAQIETDEKTLNGDSAYPANIGKIRKLKYMKQKRRLNETENEAAFTNIARTIGTAIAATGAASRTYRSPQAKADFEKVTAAALCTEDELDGHVLALKQELLPALDELRHPQVSDTDPRDALETAQECLARAAFLSTSTVETEVINRLAEHPNIAEWVETGLDLHGALGSTHCEFCGEPITSDRMAQLARHFNDADRRLKAEIDDVLTTLRSILVAVREYAAPDKARLYSERRDQYGKAVEALATGRQALEQQITDLGVALREKKARTTESVPLETQISTEAFANAVSSANAEIKIHNSKSAQFAAVQQRSLAAIKTHHLSTVFDEVNRRNEAIRALDEELPRREAEIAGIQGRVAAARAQISSAHAACEQINTSLMTFLGRDELQFEPLLEEVADEDGDVKPTIVGYKIMRGDAPATYLSEGEKTALAFVYFVVHLRDGQFPKGTGIVVIDDPISSLDSNSLYQAFSFLKNSVLDCGQVFVLTHNFDFLKLLLNWRGGARRSKTGFYMIKNHVGDTQRQASIDTMDKELREYESEYHYLFKRLKEMRAEQDGSIMRAYAVPNIARKVWDTFLMFQVPSGSNPYTKMDELKDDGHDAQKLDAIYKFTNDQSHITGAGFDPALVPETQKVLDNLFEMMRTIAPRHFEILDQATPI